MSRSKLGVRVILICTICAGVVYSGAQANKGESSAGGFPEVHVKSGGAIAQRSSTSTNVESPEDFFERPLNPPEVPPPPFPPDGASGTCYHKQSGSSGWLEGASRLPESGEGYYYFPSSDVMNTDNWACGDYVIKHIIDIGREWEGLRENRALIGVGDLSWHENSTIEGAQGGKFPGHISHQNGLDVDLRYLRKDGDPLPLDLAGDGLSNYDREATQEVVDLFLEHGAELILAHRTSGLNGPPQRLLLKADHRDHFHVRFPLPK